MSSFDGTPEASRANKLAMNAGLYRYDKTLEDAVDLFHRDPAAWQKLPLIVQDRSGLYLDARTAYRRAVAAGAVADDRGPGSEKETNSW